MSLTTNHTIRTKTGNKEVVLTPTRAIKLMCTECMGWEEHPDGCTSTFCPLFPYRGKSFGRKVKKVTPE